MLTVVKFKLKHSQLGFTLIEMMIVVAVIGILTALSLPSYRMWIANTKTRTVAESIQTGLQKARIEAVKHNARVQFVLGANSAWTIGCVTPVADLNGDGVDDCPATIESRVAGEGSTADVNVIATPAASTTIVFTNLGTVLPAPVPFTQLDMDHSQLAAADDRELRITVGTGGVSRMCDPDSGLSSTDPRKC